jgi:hypothetical protein
MACPCGARSNCKFETTSKTLHINLMEHPMSSTQSADSWQKKSTSNLNRQIGLYSLAAAVAGVSMLALTEPAAGEVVVTHKTIPIPLSPQSKPQPVHVSLANNGVENFTFFLDGNLSFREPLVDGVGRDGVIDGGTWSVSAMALAPAKKSVPKTLFITGTLA